MSDYVKITDFAAKDTLLTGNPAKLVKGAEIGAELDAIAIAVATKLDTNGDDTLNSLTVTTTLAAATVNATTVNATTLDMTNVEVSNIKAKDGTASASIADATGVMTINSAVLTTADINGGTADNVVIGGSTPAAASVTTLTASSKVTTPTVGVDADSQHTLPNVAADTFTLNAATQTLTNKTLTSPTLTTPALGTPSSGTLTSCTGLPVATGISGLGTGVATALAVNIGSAGAPVVLNGALGTPSSGTVTNLTGTASININGTVGATTPASGAFTTLSSSGNATLGDDPATDTHTINGGLTVKNTGSGNSLLIEDSASTDSTPFVIDASGNVAIGSATTINPLTIYSTGVGASIRRFTATGSAGTALELMKSASATIGTNAIVSSGDVIGRLTWYGSDNSSFVTAAQIACEVDGTPGTNDMPGRLVFSTTADGASSSTERMRIDSAGLVTLASGQIKFPATQNASADANTLDDYREATATLTATGMTTTPTGTGTFVRVGNKVTMEIPAITGTSNATTFTLTGIPTAFRPTGNRIVLVRTQDNSAAFVVAIGLINSSGVLTLFKTPSGDAFTNSGVKSVDALNVSYII